MIEPVMYFGLGFLVASLFSLIILPLVHARAERLTARRLEAATPVSMAEIQADKDQLRAEFAMSTRRLELSVEQLKAKTSSQLAELGKKTDAINRLKVELDEKSATIFALEARDKTLRDQLHATEEELALKTNALREAERSLADRQAELTRLMTELHGTSTASAGQGVEIVALQTQIDTLQETVTTLEQEIKETESRLAQERIRAEAATKELANERGTVENLGKRVGHLEQQLAKQTAEAESLSKRVAELEEQAAAQGRRLAERERERDQLRRDLEAARGIEADLRNELSSLGRHNDSAAEALRADKARVESQLELTREERAKLQREITAMKREAEASWGAERVENALLRERINDVAAEVARLTAALEGPGSPIDTILAKGSAPRLQPNRPHPAPSGNETTTAASGDAKGSLADRIRALQARASRLSSAT